MTEVSIRGGNLFERMGDPGPRSEQEPGERPVRSATDLVISLSTTGRSVRLFSADGDAPRRYSSLDPAAAGFTEGHRDH